MSKNFVSKKFKIINNKLINELGKPAKVIHSPIMYHDSIYYNTSLSNKNQTIYRLIRYTDTDGIHYGQSNIINKNVIVIDTLGTFVELKEKNKNSYTNLSYNYQINKNINYSNKELFINEEIY